MIVDERVVTTSSEMRVPAKYKSLLPNVLALTTRRPSRRNVFPIFGCCFRLRRTFQVGIVVVVAQIRFCQQPHSPSARLTSYINTMSAGASHWSSSRFRSWLWPQNSISRCIHRFSRCVCRCNIYEVYENELLSGNFVKFRRRLFYTIFGEQNRHYVEVVDFQNLCRGGSK